MKIVFLDIDGVMNGVLRWPDKANRRWIDPEAVRRLNEITRATDAQIVVTSTWRRFWDAAGLLRSAGVEGIICDQTPFMPGKPRGDEIAGWLHEHAVDQFVILDDDSDMGNLAFALVQPEWSIGLEDRHVGEAIAKLS